MIIKVAGTEHSLVNPVRNGPPSSRINTDSTLLPRTIVVIPMECPTLGATQTTPKQDGNSVVYHFVVKKYAPPTSENAEECLLDPRGESYMGLKSTTKSGLTCQSWSIQSPHAHAFSRLLGNQKNYCRNPDGEPKPWCYTTNKTKRFELCEIPECAACNIYQEEGPDCKVVYKVSGNCYYKSHYRNECKYTVRLSKNKEGQGEVTIKYGKESFKILKDQHILKCAYFKNVGDYLLIEEKISDKC
ncbi:plasminogen-like [Saccostrea cucullata]|uniref:plasminogen-like n=1 Tax=Saccostrea cuccullata TaxID=36930 RepID=UPI002ED3502B